MKYTKETIKQILLKNPETQIIYFWRHQATPGTITETCLSQWYNCTFEVEGQVYHTAEQFMMASKARLFNDNEVLAKIMAADDPHDYKKLGREIRGFEPTLWDANKCEIVAKGNKAKFGQNAELKEYLLSTGNAILIEASPYDKIWGIGLDPQQAKQTTIDQWQGEGLLGLVLMEVRDWLRG